MHPSVRLSNRQKVCPAPKEVPLYKKCLKQIRNTPKYLPLQCCLQSLWLGHGKEISKTGAGIGDASGSPVSALLPLTDRGRATLSQDRSDGGACRLSRRE